MISNDACVYPVSFLAAYLANRMTDFGGTPPYTHMASILHCVLGNSKALRRKVLFMQRTTK